MGGIQIIRDFAGELPDVTAESAALLVVQDTGAGMTRGLSERGFLSFSTTKDVSEGTGLGRAVAHGIVTSHGGLIQVDSQPANGMRFEIHLPVNAPENLAEGV